MHSSPTSDFSLQLELSLLDLVQHPVEEIFTVPSFKTWHLSVTGTLTESTWTSAQQVLFFGTCLPCPYTTPMLPSSHCTSCLQRYTFSSRKSSLFPWFHWSLEATSVLPIIEEHRHYHIHHTLFYLTDVILHVRREATDRL